VTAEPPRSLDHAIVNSTKRDGDVQELRWAVARRLRVGVLDITYAMHHANFIPYISVAEMVLLVHRTDGRDSQIDGDSI
jgi:hypothetical protein